MLTALHQLSTVTVQTLDASKNDIIADLQQLGPILRNLANTGSSLPKSLQILLTFPFTDQAVGGIKGDYLNGYVTTAFNTPGGRTTPLTVPAGGVNSVLAPPPSLLPTTSSAAPGLAPSITLHANGGAR
jgi:phospholipid/cholesterol/gamma-HCH transport system substrate-binding protein